MFEKILNVFMITLQLESKRVILKIWKELTKTSILKFCVSIAGSDRGGGLVLPKL